MTKIYKSAPLPFQGQKRRYVGEFRRVLGQIRDARISVSYTHLTLPTTSRV